MSNNDEYTQPERRLSGDEKLRAENPGLKELWDQYQTMLKLCKPAEDSRLADSAADVLSQIRQRLNKATPSVQPKFKPKEISFEERLDQLEQFMKQYEDTDK